MDLHLNLEAVSSALDAFLPVQARKLGASSIRSSRGRVSTESQAARRSTSRSPQPTHPGQNPTKLVQPLQSTTVNTPQTKKMAITITSSKPKKSNVIKRPGRVLDAPKVGSSPQHLTPLSPPDNSGSRRKGSADREDDTKATTGQSLSPDAEQRAPLGDESFADHIAHFTNSKMEENAETSVVEVSPVVEPKPFQHSADAELDPSLPHKPHGSKATRVDEAHARIAALSKTHRAAQSPEESTKNSTFDIMTTEFLGTPKPPIGPAGHEKSEGSPLTGKQVTDLVHSSVDEMRTLASQLVAHSKTQHEAALNSTTAEIPTRSETAVATKRPSPWTLEEQRREKKLVLAEDAELLYDPRRDEKPASGFNSKKERSNYKIIQYMHRKHREASTLSESQADSNRETTSQVGKSQRFERGPNLQHSQPDRRPKLQLGLLPCVSDFELLCLSCQAAHHCDSSVGTSVTTPRTKPIGALWVPNCGPEDFGTMCQMPYPLVLCTDLRLLDQIVVSTGSHSEERLQMSVDKVQNALWSKGDGTSSSVVGRSQHAVALKISFLGHSKVCLVYSSEAARVLTLLEECRKPHLWQSQLPSVPQAPPPLFIAAWCDIHRPLFHPLRHSVLRLSKPPEDFTNSLGSFVYYTDLFQGHPLAQVGSWFISDHDEGRSVGTATVLPFLWRDLRVEGKVSTPTSEPLLRLRLSGPFAPRIHGWEPSRDRVRVVMARADVEPCSQHLSGIVVRPEEVNRLGTLNCALHACHPGALEPQCSSSLGPAILEVLRIATSHQYDVVGSTMLLNHPTSRRVSGSGAWSNASPPDMSQLDEMMDVVCQWNYPQPRVVVLFYTGNGPEGQLGTGNTLGEEGDFLSLFREAQSLEQAVSP